jgi:SsrA-binding protein
MKNKTERQNQKKEASTEERQIAVNRRARFEYFIEETFEAGLVLQGWEVKALRAGRAQISESYVIIKNQELWLIGAHITPLTQTCTHEVTDSTRTRKLMLQRKQISVLVGKVERVGYTLIPLDLHWTRGRAKLQIALAKGKKDHDKRETIKERDWQREKGRILRHEGR